MIKESMSFGSLENLEPNDQLGRKEDFRTDEDRLDEYSAELIETEHKIELLDDEINKVVDEILELEGKMIKGDDGIGWSALNANRESKMREHTRKDEERSGLVLAKRILEEKIKDIKEARGELTMFREDSLN
jgi:hypothetical protein